MRPQKLRWTGDEEEESSEAEEFQPITKQRSLKQTQALPPVDTRQDRSVQADPLTPALHLYQELRCCV